MLIIILMQAWVGQGIFDKSSEVLIMRNDSQKIDFFEKKFKKIEDI